MLFSVQKLEYSILFKFFCICRKGLAINSQLGEGEEDGAMLKYIK